MFMKIFTVIIISFNNIFTIPQNINNDKITTQSLIRNKRQNNQVSEINLTKAEFTIWKNETPYKPAPAWKTELQFLLNDIEKQSGIKPINPIEELWNNKGRIQSYINQNQVNIIKKLNELQINTKWTEVEKEQKQNIKIKNIKIKFEYQKDTFAGVRWNWWKILEFNAQLKVKPTTDIDLPETTTKFDGNHNYNEVVDNLDYLMIHRGDFDKFNYSYLYWTPVFNFIDTLEKGYCKEFTIKNHGFKDESYFYHKNSTILPNSEIIGPTNVTKIEVIKKIKKRLNETINNLTGVNNAIEGIDYNAEIKDNDNNYLDDSATFDLTTDNVADRTFTVKFTATETSTQLQGTNTIKMVIPKQEDTNDNVLKIKAFNKTLIAGNNYLQLLHAEKEIWKYDTKSTNDYYLIKYLFGTLNYLNVRFSFLRYMTPI